MKWILRWLDRFFFTRYDVFLSYSAEDQDMADKVAAAFRENDFKVFLARDTLRPGTDWVVDIHDALGASGAGVILVSRNSARSHHVAAEEFVLRVRARRDGIALVPLIIDGTSLRGRFAGLDDFHAMTIAGMAPSTLDEQLDQLCRTVQRQATRLHPRLLFALLVVAALVAPMVARLIGSSSVDPGLEAAQQAQIEVQRIAQRIDDAGAATQPIFAGQLVVADPVTGTSAVYAWTNGLLTTRIFRAGDGTAAVIARDEFSYSGSQPVTKTRSYYRAGSVYL